MKRRNNLTVLGLLAPMLIGLAVFFFVPFIILIRYTFTETVGGHEFVGLQNYVAIMKSNAFKTALLNTGKFLVIGVVLIMVLSFLLALMIQKKFAGSKLLRSVILFPMFLPVAAVVTIVTVFFSDAGLVNNALTALGISAKEWLTGPAAFPLVLGIYIVKNIGFDVILFLAGLNMIPKELYESAEMEGAGAFRRVFDITLPLITPTTFFVFIISVMNCFKSFREVFVLGGEYPDKSIYMLPHFINNNISNLNYQRLAVASVIVFLIIAIITGVFYVLESRSEERL